MIRASYGETCGVGDRVTVITNPRQGVYEHKGSGTVIAVREGINRILTVRMDDGTTGRYGWKNICQENPE